MLGAHADQDEVLVDPLAVAASAARSNREHTYSSDLTRQRAAGCASALFSDALEFGRVTSAAAAESLGVSPQLVARKRVAQSPSLADVLLLIEGGGRATEAAQLLVGALQRRIDDVRGRSAPPWRLLPVLSCGVGAVVGELLSAASLAFGSEAVAREKAKEILERCAAAHKQIAAVEACVGRLVA